MVRIKIIELARGKKICREEMKKIFGGTIFVKDPCSSTGYYLGSDPYVISDPSPRTPFHLSELFGGRSECGGKKK